ncbi:MAG: sialidase family protein, partial [Patescibacteria group bacterium]
MIAVAKDSWTNSQGRVYTSSDSGVNWTERTPAGAGVYKEWWAAASDSDGSNLIVTDSNGDIGGGRIYTSSDSGASWTERQPAGDVNKYWGTVASDSDGSNLIAATYGNGRVYTSFDSGASWTERQPAGDADIWWNSVASDSTGANLMAGSQQNGPTGGRLYTASVPTPGATATLNGNITATGGSNATTRGFKYGLTETDTWSVSENGDFSTGAYTGSLTGLPFGTTYYYRSFATNAQGTSYGSYVSFVTGVNTPALSTQSASGIGTTTSTANGTITATNGANATTRGFKYGLTQADTWSVSENGSFGTGAYTGSLTGLSPGTTYYVRSFATNSGGTNYGTYLSFTTNATAPTLTTQSASGIGTTTSTANGTITATNGANATTRGFKYGLTETDTWTVSESGSFGTGAYTGSLTGLSPNTTYYVRAFATNSVGTSYGSYVSFLTSIATPTVSTQSATNTVSTSTTANGNITDTGGANATTRGFKYGLTQTDTWTVSESGSFGTGAYSLLIPSLDPSVTYYIR